jgi:hypothetical protein
VLLHSIRSFDFCTNKTSHERHGKKLRHTSTQNHSRERKRRRRFQLPNWNRTSPCDKCSKGNSKFACDDETCGWNFQVLIFKTLSFRQLSPLRTKTKVVYDDELRRLVVEFLWIVSAGRSGDKAARKRKGLVRTFLQVLWAYERDKDLGHDQIYGLILSWGNYAIGEVEGDFIPRLLTVLNASNPDTGEYQQRDCMVSLCRHILGLIPGTLELTAVSDKTCERNGATADPERHQRRLRQMEGAALKLSDLAGLDDAADADPREEIEDDVAVGLGVSGDTGPSYSSAQLNTMMQLFRNGQYDDLNKQQFIDVFSSRLELLAGFLAVGSTTSAHESLASQAPAGHSEDDFSRNTAAAPDQPRGD